MNNPNYPLPTECDESKDLTVLKMRLHPKGAFDFVDPYEFERCGESMRDSLVSFRLGEILKSNLRKGLKGDFEPTFSLVHCRNPLLA